MAPKGTQERRLNLKLVFEEFIIFEEVEFILDWKKTAKHQGGFLNMCIGIHAYTGLI